MNFPCLFETLDSRSSALDGQRRNLETASSCLHRSAGTRYNRAQFQLILASDHLHAVSTWARNAAVAVWWRSPETTWPIQRPDRPTVAALPENWCPRSLRLALQSASAAPQASRVPAISWSTAQNRLQHARLWTAPLCLRSDNNGPDVRRDSW